MQCSWRVSDFLKDIFSWIFFVSCLLKNSFPWKILVFGLNLTLYMYIYIFFRLQIMKLFYFSVGGNTLPLLWSCFTFLFEEIQCNRILFSYWCVHFVCCFWVLILFHCLTRKVAYQFVNLFIYLILLLTFQISSLELVD